MKNSRGGWEPFLIFTPRKKGNLLPSDDSTSSNKKGLPGWLKGVTPLLTVSTSHNNFSLVLTYGTQNSFTPPALVNSGLLIMCLQESQLDQRRNVDGQKKRTTTRNGQEIYFGWKCIQVDRRRDRSWDVHVYLSGLWARFVWNWDLNLPFTLNYFNPHFL